MKRIVNMICLCLGIAVAMSSCTVEENIHFKEDFSGRYEISVDVSALMSLGGEELSDSVLHSDLSELEERMMADSEISNFKMAAEGGVITIGLDFKDPSFFENFYAASDVNEQKPRFELKGKELKIRFKEETYEMDMGEGDDEAPPTPEEKDSQKQLLSQFTYTTVITFDRPIKKVKSKIATYEKGSSEVRFEYNFDEASRNFEAWETVIKFK